MPEATSTRRPGPPGRHAQPMNAPAEFEPVGPGAPGLRRRRYQSYDQYARHQAEKLRCVRPLLEPSDRAYEAILRQRLGPLGPWQGRSVLCLGARLGGEVRAFKALGAFAVGIDLEPGPRSEHVLTGDFHHLAFPDRCADALFTNALDHAFDLPRLLDEAHRVLKPAGTLIIELITERPGRYEALDTSDPAPILALVRRRFDTVVSSPVRTRTEYLDWAGTLLVLTPRSLQNETSGAGAGAAAAPSGHATDGRCGEAA